MKYSVLNIFIYIETSAIGSIIKYHKNTIKKRL